MLSELKRIRKSRTKYSQSEVAEKLNIPQGTYRNWEQCINMPSDPLVVKKIADLFHVSIEALFGYDMVEPGALSEAYKTRDDGYTWVPLYGSIAAGAEIEMIDIEEYFPIPSELSEKYPRAYLLKVKGESMNLKIPNGSYALINPCNEAETGKVYAVTINGYEATLKRVRVLNNGYELIPDSNDPTFKPKVYDYSYENTEYVKILGRVVYVFYPFDYEY